MISSRFVIAITGASGVIYGQRLVQELAERSFEVNLIISLPGRQIIKEELKIDLFSFSLSEQVSLLFPEISSTLRRKIKIFEVNNLFAPFASGSFVHRGMVIAPCSGHTLAAVAGGLSSNLIERAADVCLKQKRPLVLLIRETPLHQIHLENMLKLSQSGAMIMPASPGYYHHPRTIEDQVNFIVGKILDLFSIPHQLYSPWEEKLSSLSLKSGEGGEK